MMDLGDGVPPGLTEDTDASLSESERLGRCWHGAAGGRLRYALAPRRALVLGAAHGRDGRARPPVHGYMLQPHPRPGEPGRDPLRA